MLTTLCFEYDFFNSYKFKLNCVMQIVNSLQEKQSLEDECVALASVQSRERKKERFRMRFTVTLML